MTPEEERARARTAVEHVDDSGFREIAYQAILAHTSRTVTWRCYVRCENLIWLAVGVVLATAGVLSLWCSAPTCFCVAVLVDLCIVVLLVLVAIRSDGRDSISKLLPDRLTALFLLVLLLVALVSSFGNMYLQSGGIRQAGCADYHATYSAEKNLVVLKTRVDALYFSSVTMMTLGYGDYVPVTSDTRKLVIWQLASGALLLLLGFPLLISRMASF